MANISFWANVLHLGISLGIVWFLYVILKWVSKKIVEFFTIRKVLVSSLTWAKEKDLELITMQALAMNCLSNNGPDVVKLVRTLDLWYTFLLARKTTKLYRIRYRMLINKIPLTMTHVENKLVRIMRNIIDRTSSTDILNKFSKDIEQYHIRLMNNRPQDRLWDGIATYEFESYYMGEALKTFQKTDMDILHELFSKKMINSIRYAILTNQSYKELIRTKEYDLKEKGIV